MKSNQIPADKALAFLNSLTHVEEDASVDIAALVAPYLHHPDDEVRAVTLEKLRNEADPDLLADIWQMAEEDGNLAVREQAILALGGYVDAAAYAADYMDDLDESELSETEVDELLSYLWAVLEDEEETAGIRQAALQSLSAWADEAFETTIAAAWDTFASSWRPALLYAMGRTGLVRWAPQVIEALSSNDPETLYQATWTAGQLGVNAAIPRLAELALTATNNEIQLEAVTSLGQLSDMSALDNLVEVIRRTSSDELRETAWYAIEDFKDSISMEQIDMGSTEEEFLTTIDDVEKLVEGILSSRLPRRLLETRPSDEDDEDDDLPF